MNRAIEAEEEEVDEQEGQAITAIRKVLSATSMIVSTYDDNGVFSDIDSFVKLSQGNTSITEVDFYPYDKEGDDALWEKVGEGLANLKSLERLTIYFEEEDEANADEPTPRPDLGTLAIVLPYLRQELVVNTFNYAYSREEVKALARAIRRHPTIVEFDTGCSFPADTLHIILSALATLPSLEVARLEHEDSEGSHFEYPQALKKLMLSPSLREVYFTEILFCGPLCRALEEALQGGSNVTLLSLEVCHFPAGAGD
jgi:hypothetical protein